MLEEILDIRNVRRAFRQVTAFKEAGGIDGMQTDELRARQCILYKVEYTSFANYYYGKIAHQEKLF